MSRMLMAGRKFGDTLCVVCCKQFSTDPSNKAVKVIEGRDRLMQCSFQRGDHDLTHYLLAKPENVYVHEGCRRDYQYLRAQQSKRPADTDASSESSGRAKFLRSSTDSFDWKTTCFLCGKPAVRDKKHPDRCDVHEAKSDEITRSMLSLCDDRNDDWAFEVKGRLLTCGDLHAADAVYHARCRRRFSKLGSRCSVDVVAGRSVDCDMFAVFDVLCETLECADSELYTIQELLQMMTALSGDDCNVYSSHYFKQKLQERFGDTIFFADVCGRKNVVCFRDVARRVITDKWYADRETDVAKESQRIIETAAKLIKAEIRAATFSMDEYPVNSTVQDRVLAKQWLPSLLRQFMETVVHDEVKQIAVGHSIVQASRPRSVVSPVLFGLGVSVDHVAGSTRLLQTMSRLGFAVSPDEVNRFKQSVVQVNDKGLPHHSPDHFTQWAADNVDHNVATLDGLGTFHGMGLISMTTSNCASDTAVGLVDRGNFGDVPVTRLQRVNADTIARAKTVPMHHYSVPNIPSMTRINFEPFVHLLFPHTLPASANMDLLWQLGWYFCNDSEPRPNWSGFMQNVAVGEHQSSADIQLLPIIDMNPSNKSCILSTLLFVIDQAKLLNIETPCITFDQPLWIKAVEIVKSEGLDVVCRLGVFHMLMSFLGSIGAVMSGSGLCEVLECCYGPNAVAQMISGKAVARAMRGHQLVDSALYVLLLKTVFDDGKISDDDIATLRSLYDATETGTFDGCNVDMSQSLVTLSGACCDKKAELAAASRTARLWLQYMYYVDVLRTVIRAERTSDWNLHLLGVSKMLNLFAATGHNHYAKCARLYLQMMERLPTEHEWLYNNLSSGNHSIRRSDRFWGGLSTDLIIEQVMMKAVKGRGGLTHGRGMTDSVRSLWVHSMHKCASVHSAITVLAGCDLPDDSTESRHVELGHSRKTRDFNDLRKVLEWFADHNPFDVSDSRLRSIATGVVAADEDKVTCDRAEEVGHSIMEQMDNKSFAEVVMRRASQVRTLSVIFKKVQSGNKHIVVDPDVLFARLLLVMSQSGDMESCFCHELTTLPSALFTDSGLRKTDKSMLAKEITRAVDTTLQVHTTCKYVVDGGCLLRRVVWPKSGTYLDVVHVYLGYIQRHYKDCVVVFDGYCNGPSLKDHEHIRRASAPAPLVSIEDHMPVYRNQGAFLMNSENKHCFVGMLSRHMKECGLEVLQAQNDADTLIAHTALNIAASKEEVVVVADDTDVLVLLVHHFKPDMADIRVLSEITRIRNPRVSVVSVRAVCNSIDNTAAEQLLAVHALSGCDTTSALFGHGKAGVYRKVVENPDTKPLTDVLSSVDASQTAVVEAGLKLLLMLYSAKPSDTLNHLRYTTYMNLVATGGSKLRPQRLPPTERAARFHLLRVHLQTVLWETLTEDHLNPEEWGWKLEDGAYVPIPTDMQPAPEQLLSVIACKCKMTTKNPCGSQLCSCRQHGMLCVAACKHCCGEDCTNAAQETDAAACESYVTDECEDDTECVDVVDDIVSTEYYWDSDEWIDEEVISSIA